MKLKFSANPFVNTVLILAVILFCVRFSVYIVYNSYTAPHSLGGFTYNTLKPVDPEIPDTTSYAKYQALKQQQAEIRDFKNGVWPYDGGTMLGWFLATDGGLICDTCTVYRPIDHGKFMPDPGTPQYYVKLPAWGLPSKQRGYDVLAPQFYVAHGQSYVRKFVQDAAVKGSPNQISFHQIDVPVKFRYNNKENAMLIPVSASTKHVISGLLIGLIALFGGWFIYLVGLFLKFMVDISKGLTFNNVNLNRLKLIGFSLIGFPILMLLLPFVPRLIFSSYFTDDIVLNKEVWNQSWEMLGVGIVFLLLFKAFEQGKTLKEEQELTV